MGNDRYSESLSINIPNGLFPSPGAKEITLFSFSPTSGSYNSVFVEPEGHSSTSHQPSLLSPILPALSTSVVEILSCKSCVLSIVTVSSFSASKLALNDVTWF